MNEANHDENQMNGAGSPVSDCSGDWVLQDVLAGNALYFLMDLRPLYDYINASTAPREVRECLKRINLAAASIRGALGEDGCQRAKERDDKMKADLERFLSQNAEAIHGEKGATK